MRGPRRLVVAVPVAFAAGLIAATAAYGAAPHDDHRGQGAQHSNGHHVETPANPNPPGLAIGRQPNEGDEGVTQSLAPIQDVPPVQSEAEDHAEGRAREAARDLAEGESEALTNLFRARFEEEEAGNAASEFTTTTVPASSLRGASSPRGGEATAAGPPFFPFLGPPPVTVAPAVVVPAIPFAPVAPAPPATPATPANPGTPAPPNPSSPPNPPVVVNPLPPTIGPPAQLLTPASVSWVPVGVVLALIPILTVAIIVARRSRINGNGGGH